MEDAEKSSVAEAWTSPEHTTAPQSSPPPAAAGEKLDWQERLDTLQSHHKLESFQQQREHLEQLQSFREQLLLDLSTQVSAGASTGHNEAPLTSLQSHDHRHDDDGDTLTSVNESLGFLQHSPSTATAPLVRTSTVESLTSKEPTVLPADDRSARVEDVTTPVKSFASFTENAEWDRIAQQTHMSPYSPGRLGGKFPSKQQFSPSKTPGEERTPLKVQPSWLQRSPFGPASQTTVSTPSPRASDAGYKTALVEKHNKHVRDLKGYYEAEVQELKQQLEESRRLQANGERAKKSVSSQPASAELKMKCTHLQTQLQESQRETRRLEKALKRSEERMAEYEGRRGSLERMVVVLQDSLEASRTRLTQQDEETGRLHSDLQDTAEELLFWKERGAQSDERMEQLLYECDAMQRGNKDMQESVSLLEQELRQCTVDIQRLEGVVSNYKAAETQHKSEIAQLEEEVRRLQLTNNRLNSLTTHYQLGTYRPPQANSSSSASGRVAGEQCSPAVRVARTPPPQRLPSSDLPPPPPSSSLSLSLSPAARGCGVQREGGRSHLTRKKWLEPSDPGLIIGGVSSPAHPLQSDGSRSSMLQHRSPSGSPAKRATSHRSPTTILEATSKRGVLSRWPDEEEEEEEAPVNNENSDPEAVLDSTLHAVRQGTLLAGDKDGPYKGHRRNKAGSKKNKHGKDNSMSIEERVQQYMRIAEQSEQKLVTLQTEKKQLQSALQRAPKSEGRVTAKAKQAQYDMERRLDEVDREISSLKMVLRTHHVLRK